MRVPLLVCSLLAPALLAGCGAAVAPAEGAAVTEPPPAAPPPEPAAPPPTGDAATVPDAQASVETPAKEAMVEGSKKEPSKMAMVQAPRSNKLSQDDIATGISDAEELFVPCHALGAKGKAPFTATVTVKLGITADGKVDDAAVQKSTAKSPTIDKCVADAVSRITFPKAKDGQPSVFTVPIELRAPTPPRP